MLIRGFYLCRAMVEDKKGRVDFGMAEALAFGTLALHRGVRPPNIGSGDIGGRPELQPSTVDSQLQQEELIGGLDCHCDMSVLYLQIVAQKSGHKTCRAYLIAPHWYLVMLLGLFFLLVSRHEAWQCKTTKQPAQRSV